MVNLLGICSADLDQVLLGQKNTTAVAATELKELVGQRNGRGDLEVRVGIEPTFKGFADLFFRPANRSLLMGR